MTQNLQVEDFVILPDFRLVSNNLITPDEKKTEGGSPELKVQLFFEAPKYDKSSRQLIPAEMCRFLGFYTRVKVSDPTVEQLFNIGLDIGSIVTMRCIPNPWILKIWDDDKKKVKEERLGIWFQLESLLKLDGRDVNFRVIQPKAEQPKTDAFARFRAKKNGGDTATIERDFNSELDSYMEA